MLIYLVKIWMNLIKIQMFVPIFVLFIMIVKWMKLYIYIALGMKIDKQLLCEANHNSKLFQECQVFFIDASNLKWIKIVS